MLSEDAKLQGNDFHSRFFFLNSSYKCIAVSPTDRVPVGRVHLMFKDQCELFTFQPSRPSFGLRTAFLVSLPDSLRRG
jgi:hypothetical protein